MYSIENEIMLCGGERVSTTEKNLGDLGRYVKSLDPTRPIMFEGDDDPDGAADVINLHYPYEFPAHVDYPNFADWLDGPAVLETYPRRIWEWSRAKPLYMGEFLWMFQQSSSGYTGLLGDSAYEDDANRRAKALAWGYQIEAYRKAGLAGIDPWTLWESGAFPNVLYDVVKEAYEPNAAFVDEYDSRFFSGQAGAADDPALQRYTCSGQSDLGVVAQRPASGAGDVCDATGRAYRDDDYADDADSGGADECWLRAGCPQWHQYGLQSHADLSGLSHCDWPAQSAGGHADCAVSG